jgi:hypothetical protein
LYSMIVMWNGLESEVATKWWYLKSWIK